MIWRETVQSLQDSQDDSLWLISHASYLVRTGGLLWAVDPRLSVDMHLQADDTLAQDLNALRVAMITHLHPDHYDKPLIRTLAAADIHWIFPAFMPPSEQHEWQEILPLCSFLHAGEEICVRGLKVQAFESVHYDYFKGERCGVEEIGYCVAVEGKTFLFPGDVRNYDCLPEIQKGADEFFAHIWLGREAALSPTPEMTERFCRYFASAKAQRMWLGHLNDMSRMETDRWTEAHAQLLKDGIQKKAPEMEIRVPEHGKQYLL